MCIETMVPHTSRKWKNNWAPYRNRPTKIFVVVTGAGKGSAPNFQLLFVFSISFGKTKEMQRTCCLIGLTAGPIERFRIMFLIIDSAGLKRLGVLWQANVRLKLAWAQQMICPRRQTHACAYEKIMHVLMFLHPPMQPFTARFAIHHFRYQKYWVYWVWSSKGCVALLFENIVAIHPARST